MVKAEVSQKSLICDENIGFSDGVKVDVLIKSHKPIRDMFHGCLEIDDILIIEEIAESDDLSDYY